MKFKASDAQWEYITNLAEERVLTDAEALYLDQVITDSRETPPTAHALIEWMQGLPRKPAVELAVGVYFRDDPESGMGGGTYYLVRHTRGGERRYASALLDAHGEPLTYDSAPAAAQNYQWRYIEGMMRNLKPEMKMSEADQELLLAKYPVRKKRAGVS